MCIHITLMCIPTSLMCIPTALMCIHTTPHVGFRSAGLTMASAEPPKNSHLAVPGARSKETEESQAGAKRSREALISGTNQQVIVAAASHVFTYYLCK